MKKKKSTSKANIVLILVVMIFVFTIVIINHRLKTNHQNITNQDIQVVYDQMHNEIAVNQLAEMDESSRMQYYVSEFIEAIENNQYEKAYTMLYDDFKTNYFPSINEFESYCKETFPKMFSVTYENIERNGDIYIMWVKCNDALSGKKNAAVSFNFVVKENNLNDFVLSFSVK